MVIRRTGTPVRERGVARAPAPSVHKPEHQKTEKAQTEKAQRATKPVQPPVDAADVIENGAEARRLTSVAETVGEERTLHVDEAPAAQGPMALRFFALQQAGSLDVDEERAGKTLDDARGRSQGKGEPEVPLLHGDSRLVGTAEKGHLIDPLEREQAVEAAGMSGSASAVVAGTSSRVSANLGREGESELGSHRTQAQGSVNASGAGIEANAGGEAGYRTTTDDGAEVNADAQGGVTATGGGVAVTAGGEAGYRTTTNDGAEVSAGAKSGVRLDKEGLQVDMGVDASRRQVREQELEGGGKRTIVNVDNATGNALKGSFSGEHSRTTRTERPVEGGSDVHERTTGVRGDSTAKNLEAFGSDTRTETRGEQVRARRVEGRAGLLGADGKVTVEERDQRTGEGRRRSSSASAVSGRVSLQGEAARLGREEAPDGSVRDVEKGVAGGLEVHRLGFKADGHVRSSDGEGGMKARGGDVVYDPTGVAFGASRSADKADGDGTSATDGIKLNPDQAGFTFSRAERTRLSESETRGAAKKVDALVGQGKATSSFTRTRSHATLGKDGLIKQKSFFERFGANLEAFRKVNDAGPSEHPDLEGQHRVELHQKVNGGGSAFVGELSGVVGLYGGLSLQRGKEIRYRTHMDKERAALAARPDEDKGLAGKARHHLVGATFLGETRVSLPDLKRPESWRLHDEVELHTTGSFSSQLGVSAYAGRASLEVQAAGDFAVSVKKTGAEQVEVEVTPTRMRGLRGSAGAVLIDGGVGQVRAQAFAQRFSFDLGTEGGRAAYEAVLQGRLPGTLEGASVDAREAGLDLVNDDDLAPGVSRLRLEKVEVRENERSASAGWMFLRAARSTQKRNVRHMVSDRDVSVNLHTRGVDNRRKTLLSGNEHSGVSGSLRAVTVLDDAGRRVSTFESLTLEASFSDDKIKGKELDDDVIARINRSFGLELEGARRKGKKETQEVRLTARLTPASLDRLAEADAALVARVARERGGKAKALASLVADVRHAGSEPAAAKRVQAFVAAHGADGMGQVLALAGAEDELRMSSSSSAYDAPLAEAATLTSRWAEQPWDAQVSKKDLSDRYGGLRGTTDKLDEGLARLEQDPFFRGREAERGELREKLEEARAGLAGLCDFSKLSVEDALLIHQKLEYGWTTKMQRRFQGELASEAGLSQVESGWSSAEATATRAEGGAEVRTRTTSDRRWLPLWGDERTQLSAATRRVRDADGGERVTSVRLRAEVYDEKSRFGEADRAARRVAHAFGTDVGRFEGKEPLRGTTRTLSVERTLSEEDLARLGSLDDAGLLAAAAGAPNKGRLRRLAGALADAAGAGARARVVEDHVTRHGLDGMGEVHRLLGGELSIDARSDAYDKAAASAEDVAKRHPEAVLPTATAKEVAQRFKDARVAKEALSKAEALLAGDGLLSSEARAAAQARLETAAEALDEMTDVAHLSHEDAAALVAKLEGGWTTKDEAAAADALREGAGLVSVRASRGLVRARGLRQEAQGGLEVATHAETNPSGAGERVVVRAARSLEPGAPLQLEARFHDESEKDGELGSAVVRRLNEAFGTSYASRQTRGDGSERTVTARAELDEAALARLATTKPRQLARAGLARGLDPQQTTALLDGLARANDHKGRAALVQDFVGEHGLAAMGLLHHLASPGASPELETHSKGWAQAMARADEAVLLYGARPMRGSMTRHELLTTAHAIDSAQRELSRARARAAKDPLLPADAKDALLDDMDARLTALSRAASFAELDDAARAKLASRFGVVDKWRHGDLMRRIDEGV